MDLIFGFHALADIAQTRAIEVDPDLLISAIQTSQQMHDQELSRMMRLFAASDVVAQKRFKGATLTRNQPLDENGRSRPVKGKVEYTVGFPIISSGNATGANFVTNQKMTVQQLNDVIGTMYMGDMIWMRDHILAALFDNAGYTYPDVDAGDVSVVGLANGDAVEYAFAGTEDVATDTHYLAQAAAIADLTNPLPTIRKELREHPENGREIVTFAGTTQCDAIRALTGFYAVPDPNIRTGSSVNTLIGSLGAQLPGSATIAGYCDEHWIVEWPAIPDGYTLSLAIGGTQPLIMREDEEQQLRGFRPQGRIEAFPFFDNQWFRRCGFGGWNRVGAVVQRTGNASYAVPTGFTTPMP